MTGARYLDRRRDRVQNDGGGGLSAPAAVPLPAAVPGEDPPERDRLTVVGQRFALAGLGAAGDGGAGVSRGGGDCRTAGECRGGGAVRAVGADPDPVGGAGAAPPWRAGGCALPRAPLVPVELPRAQPAEAPLLTDGAPCGASGNGGAARLPVPTPASGHCRALVWLSAVGVGSAAVPPAAEPPPAAGASPPAAPPAAASCTAVRRAQRDARAGPCPGTTTLAAPAVTRRKPKVDSRQLTWARSSAPSMP
jgi:hypothetical protein